MKAMCNAVAMYVLHNMICIKDSLYYYVIVLLELWNGSGWSVL